MNNLILTGKDTEKAFLICTTIPKSGNLKSQKQRIYKEHLEELDFLAKTAGAEVIEKFKTGFPILVCSIYDQVCPIILSEHQKDLFSFE